MNWWQTLIVAVVPVLLTLIITNIAEGKRRQKDAEERQKDREAEEDARKTARREALEDHWRAERHRQHVALLSLLSVEQQWLHDEMDYDQLEQGNEEQVKALGEHLDSGGDGALAQLEEVSCISTAECTSHAIRAAKALTQMMGYLKRVLNGEEKVTEETWNEFDDALSDAILEYRFAIRTEIGADTDLQV